MEGPILPNVPCNSAPSRELSLNCPSFPHPSLSILIVLVFCTTGGHLPNNKYSALEMTSKCRVFQQMRNLANYLLPSLLLIPYNF